MFSIKKNVWFLAAAFTLLVACTTKHNPSEAEMNPPAQPGGPSENAPGDNSGSSNGVVIPEAVKSTRWCRLDDWETFQVALRVDVSNTAVRMQYLKITPDAPPVSYQFSPRPLTSDINLPLGLFLVTTEQNPLEIPKLTGYDDQKKIAEKVLPANGRLTPREGGFNPNMAMILKTRDWYNGSVVPRNMYPCSMYSPSLNDEAPARPMIEIMMKISQEMDSWTDKDLNHIAKAMRFSEPIDEIPMEAGAMANTQWCSWQEVGPDEVMLRTVSIGNGKFNENTHSEFFKTLTDEEGVAAYLAKNASYSETYDMNFSGGRLYGVKKPETDKKKFPDKEIFAMARDGSGTRTLVKLDAKDPELSRPFFSEVYFECSNPKPLDFSSGFKARLPQVLQLQMNQLAQ